MKITRRKLIWTCVFALICTFNIWMQTGSGMFVVFLDATARSGPNDTKYILLWTSHKTLPFYHLRVGKLAFKQRRCAFDNCYILWRYSYIGAFNRLPSIDAILFHAPEIMKPDDKLFVPKVRSPYISYIFASQESSHYYPVPNTKYNGMFNFTWTYKLKSDISFKYLVVKDRDGKVIGPGSYIPWIEVKDMEPIDDNIKAKLATKHLAAAWFVSNCNSYSKREQLVANMAKELKKYNMTVDIYGRCGKHKCPTDSMKECLEKIKRDYYFYLSLENSFSEDYVTEKLLNALQNFAVPIVYGGADYTRFMPDGIYLNAKNISTKALVKQMVEIMFDKDKYYSFFKWHNHYSYHDPEEFPETDPYCELCFFVNNIDLARNLTIQDFFTWWNS